MRLREGVMTKNSTHVGVACYYYVTVDRWMSRGSCKRKGEECDDGEKSEHFEGDSEGGPVEYGRPFKHLPLYTFDSRNCT